MITSFSFSLSSRFFVSNKLVINSLVSFTQTEELHKTDNSMIFIERDTALSKEEIYQKIQVLRDACDTGDDSIAREALRRVVLTFKRPEEVNKDIA